MVSPCFGFHRQPEQIITSNLLGIIVYHWKCLQDLATVVVLGVDDLALIETFFGMEEAGDFVVTYKGV